MLDYPPDAFPLNFEDWKQLIHPEDRQAAEDNVKISLQKSDFFIIEFRYLKKNGDWLWMEGRGRVIAWDAHHQPLQMMGIHLNIQQRKQMAAELDQKEKIFNHSLDLLCISGLDGYFKLINPAWTKTLGWEEEELLTKPWLDFVHPEDREASQSVNAMLVEGQEIFRFGNRYLCRDGSYKWLSWNAFRYPSDDVIISVARDITERKIINEKLQASEERFRQLFNEMEEGFALFEMVYDELGQAIDYRFLEVNPSFERMTGLSREQILGHTIYQVIPDTQAYWVEIYAEVVSTGKPTQYENYSTAFQKWFRVSAYSPQQGQFATLISDITDLKKSEAELKETIAKLEWLFDSFPIGISILDHDQVIVRQNAALAEIYGLPRDAMLQGDHRKRDYFYPDGRSMPREELVSSRIRKGEKQVNQFIMGTLKEDGSPLWLEVSGVYAGLKDWHTILLTKNITDAMLLENENTAYQEKIKKQHQHQQAVLWLTMSLREAKNRLEAKKMVVDLLVHTYGYAAAAILCMDPKMECLPTLAGDWQPLDALNLSFSHPLIQDVLHTAQPRSVSTPQEIEELFHGANSPDSAVSLQQIILLPMIGGDQKIGVLLIASRDAKELSDEIIPSMMSIAEIIAFTLLRMGNMDSMKEMISRRTQELSTLYNVIAISGKPKDLQKKLESSMIEVLHALGCQNGGIFFLDETRQYLRFIAGNLGSDSVRTYLETTPLDNLWEGQVIKQAEPLIIPEIPSDINFHNVLETQKHHQQVYIGVPILIQDQVIGVVSLFRPGTKIFNVEEITFINALVNHIGVMIENHQLIHEAEQAVLVTERSRIARELHDSVIQTLYSAVLFSESGKDLVKHHQYQQIEEVFHQLSQLSQQGLKEMRMMIFEMRSPELVKEGLVKALRSRLDMVEKRVSIHAQLCVEGLEMEIPESAEEVIYWVAIEALNNITRHSGANEISLTLTGDESRIQLTVADNGIGFDPESIQHAGGQGIANMQERLSIYGGSIQIQTEKGHGTTLIARLPVIASKAELN